MRLDTTTTGCATLERINGNRVITQANTVLERFDLHGELTVKAPGVIIRQGIGRGGAANNGNACINVTHPDAKDCLIEDVTVVPEFPGDRQNGININQPGIIRRVNISGTVDGIMVFGDHITVQDSWIHDLVKRATTTQRDGYTHNDCIQIQRGIGVRIVGNDLSGGDNAAIMITQDVGAVSDLLIADNYLDGGGATINFGSKGDPKRNLVVINNTFGPNRRNKGMAIIRNASASPLVEFGNRFADGTPWRVHNGA